MNIRDIAKRAGVSTATVSRVINNNPNVTDKTKEKVLKVIKEQKYRPSALGRGLSKNSSDTIAIIVPDIANPFFSEIIKAIANDAAKKNLGTIIFNSDESLKQQDLNLKMACEQRVKGIFIAIATGSTEKTGNKLDDIVNFGIPVVLIDRPLPNSHIKGVFIDNILGGELATNYLINKGYQKIDIIAGPSDLISSSDRLAGYLKALEKNKLLKANVYQGDFQMESGYQIARELAKKNKLPKAIFITNNLMTLGFIKGIVEVDRALLQEVVITSFDLVDAVECLGMNIVEVYSEPQKIGSKAFSLLLGEEALKNNIKIKPKLKVV